MRRGTVRVAIYARVSTADQNPEPQLRELREYAERRSFAVHREYVDQVGGNVRWRRRAPAFDELMADARRSRFDCVLVWKYDRFARSLSALVAALQEFRDLGVDFISHTQAIDTTTPIPPWASFALTIRLSSPTMIQVSSSRFTPSGEPGPLREPARGGKRRGEDGSGQNGRFKPCDPRHRLGEVSPRHAGRRHRGAYAGPQPARR